MGLEKQAAEAKLICGLIFRDAALRDEALGRLQAEFGPVEDRSPEYPFTFTDYYLAEMGDELIRQFVVEVVRAHAAPIVSSRRASPR